MGCEAVAGCAPTEVDGNGTSRTYGGVRCAARLPGSAPSFDGGPRCGSGCHARGRAAAGDPAAQRRGCCAQHGTRGEPPAPHRAAAAYTAREHPRAARRDLRARGGGRGGGYGEHCGPPHRADHDPDGPWGAAGARRRSGRGGAAGRCRRGPGGVGRVGDRGGSAVGGGCGGGGGGCVAPRRRRRDAGPRGGVPGRRVLRGHRRHGHRRLASRVCRQGGVVRGL